MLLRSYLIALLIALAASVNALADSPPQPIPANRQCAVAADPDWTKQEKLVWARVCTGEEANFNEEPGYGGDLASSSLPADRILRPSFLETILLKDKFRNALTRFGVRIVGARFTETVDLENAELRHDLSLKRSQLEDGINLTRAETTRRIALDGSTIFGAFDAEDCQINKDLSLHNTNMIGTVNLRRAHIGNVLVLRSTVSDTLNMNGIHVDYDLFLRDRSQLHDVNLVSARIGGQLDLSSSTVTGTLNMDGIHVDYALFLRGGAQFHDVNLVGARVGGQLYLSSSTVSGMLDLNTVQVDQSLHMNEKAQFTEINLGSARIAGQLNLSSSTVTGMLNLNTVQVGRSLEMADKAQFAEIDLRGSHIGGQLDLSSSAVTGKLDLNGIHVDKMLFMRDKAQFKDIDLAGNAHVSGQIDLGSSTVTGKLNMNGIRIDQYLIMDKKAQFREIVLTGAHIGQLYLNSATVTGMLDMDDIHVDQSVFMRDKAQFSEIDLRRAHIGGQLDLNSSTVMGKLNGDYINVEQTVFLGNGTTFADEIKLTSAKLGQDLRLSGGNFRKDVDLTGTQVTGVLGLVSTKWPSATLNLTNAATGGIDLSDNWPDKIFVTGLSYRSLSNLENFRSEQAETWFGKQTYAPQPYQQLASVLQSNGRAEDATAIRYAEKKREQQMATGLNWLAMVMLHYSIGFGYHLEFAFYWAAGFVLLGWVVLYATGQRTKHGITLGLAYSFDMLLPLVQLRRKHSEIDLDPWPRRYFFAHKIVGVILTSFIVAGISGLTK